MDFIGYTHQQIKTLRALIDLTEVHGLENCKNIVMMRQIIDDNKTISVQEEVSDGKENL